MGKVLSKYDSIFDGELGFNLNKKIILVIPPQDTLPIWKMLHLIPYRYEQSHKRDQRNGKIWGPVKEIWESEWVLPIFVLPKKDNRTQIVSAFRDINPWSLQRR